MIRGLFTYRCRDCGHEFTGWDIEDNATVDSMPIKCPKCGSTKVDTPLGVLVDPAPIPYDPLIDKITRLFRSNKKN